MAKIKPIKSNATKRARQLFTKYKMSELPKLATDYARFLSMKYGGCGEVMFTAFAHYAQAVEHLKCKEDMYEITEEGTKWFNEHYHRKSHPNNVVEVNL